MSRVTHTILLIQTEKPDTRSYTDFESINDCILGVGKIYEEHLQKSGSSPSHYNMSDLLSFIDGLGDINVFVLQDVPNLGMVYLPFDKEWLKEKIFVHHRKKATGEIP